jgi:hypothetical protein
MPESVSSRYVDDVARALVESLESARTLRPEFRPVRAQGLYLAGTHEYICSCCSGAADPPLNDEMSYLQAGLMEWLPVLMSRDNYHSMKVDSVCDCAFPASRVPAFPLASSPVPLDNTPRSRIACSGFAPVTRIQRTGDSDVQFALVIGNKAYCQVAAAPADEAGRHR